MPKKSKIDALIDAVNKRFPNAKFSVSCFKSKKEIEAKILTHADIIIYSDEYINKSPDPKTGIWHDNKPPKEDNFIICKKKGSKAIYYKDVIDYLISIDFKPRDDCDHRYMEDIEAINPHNRNPYSVERYASFWGS